MRNALAPVLALSVMLASSAPFFARAHSLGAATVVTVQDAGTEGIPRAVARPLFRVAGLDPAPVRVAPDQARPINAFDTTGNRPFGGPGALPPGPPRFRAAYLRHAARRDNTTREQRGQENAMRRRSSL
jgi:hypothetical protein